jgi:hypothetical protein
LRHDIWSFGIVIFLIHNPDQAIPWQKEIVGKGGQNKEMAMRACMKAQQLPSGVLYQMAEQIENIFKLCCRYSPVARPAMSEVVTMLRTAKIAKNNVASR